MLRKRFIVIPSISLILVSCGGGGGGTNEGIGQGGSGGQGTTVVGWFVDEPVENIKIVNQANGQEVYTDASGKFTIKATQGDKLKFFIGNMYIGEYMVNTSSFVVTPGLINSTKAKLIYSLLKGFDQDNDSTNGIQLPQNVSFDVSSVNDLNPGDTVNVSVDGNTIQFTIYEDQINLDAETLAKAYNILIADEGRNIMSAPIVVNAANMKEAYYYDFSFDPVTLTAYAYGRVKGEIDGNVQIYGMNCYVKGPIECNTSDKGVLKLEQGIPTLYGQFTCPIEINYNCEGETGTESDRALCNIVLKLSNINWNNKEAEGSMSISCSFENYPELNFSTQNITVYLQGR